jgi:prepilin-type N-terminal cleavage/methylation domain-containing protein
MSSQKGQTLIEVLIGITIGAVVIGGAAGLISVTLRSNLQNKSYQVASSLNQELINNVMSFTQANWRNIYDLNKSPAQYYLSVSGTGFAAIAGAENVVVEGTTYARSFTVSNVNRDASGNISDVGTNDPSTQKITATTSWQAGNQSVFFVKYLTRTGNAVFRQMDWSGGSGQEGPLVTPNNRFATSTDIDFTSAPGAIKIQGL